MKYPKYIENRLEEIVSIVKLWPVEKSVEEVMAWILSLRRVIYGRLTIISEI